MTDVSVVISTYNRLKYLRRQLHCFNNQTHDSFEVIVADDGSNDETREWCKRAIATEMFSFPLRYTQQKHNGFRLAAVRNLGTSLAEGKRVLFTDNDCWHSAGSIAAHASQIRKNTIGVGLIHWLDKAHSTPILDETKPLPTDKALLKHAESEKRTFKREPMAVEVWGGNFSIDRKLLLKVGGHDEAFNGYGGEEIDLALRLMKHFDQSTIKILEDSIAFHIWHKRGKLHNSKTGQSILSKRRSSNYYKQEHFGSMEM